MQQLFIDSILEKKKSYNSCFFLIVEATDSTIKFRIYPQMNFLTVFNNDSVVKKEIEKKNIFFQGN